MSFKDLPKVSVLSPCYNVAPYIGRLLDSLISQTYKNLEIILVNDGSTDNTDDIIKSYLPRLQGEGYSTLYIEQANGGQSSAINNGLKHVTGKYLTWPDSDDWLTPDSIEKKVLFMEQHPECGILRGNIQPIAEDSDEQLPLFSPAAENPVLRKDFFHHLIFEKVWLAPVGYMIRSSHLDATIPEREIYVSKRAGQNWQILLPIAQKYESWELSDIVGYYLVRDDSHSHSHNDYEKQLSFIEMCEDVLINTLSRLPSGNSLLSGVLMKYNRERLELANLKGVYADMWKFGVRVLKCTNSPKEKICALLRMCISGKLYAICRRIRRKLLP